MKRQVGDIVQLGYIGVDRWRGKLARIDDVGPGAYHITILNMDKNDHNINNPSGWLAHDDNVSDVLVVFPLMDNEP